MSVFKPFVTSDVNVSPFAVNKQFTVNGVTELTNIGIDRYIGQNITSSFWVSGSNQTGTITQRNKHLVYKSIQELYYSNFLNGVNGSPVSTASFNTDGTITGETYTPSYYNYLGSTLPANRYFPTASNATVGVISIPSNLFGEYIEPSTLTITCESGSASDDGNGNLYYGNLKIGDVIYEHGMVLLTAEPNAGAGGWGVGIFGTSSFGQSNPPSIKNWIDSTKLTCSFQSHTTIYETQYKCTLRQNEFTFSQNPTLISGSSNSGTISDFATGSYFNPYITTVGLYNNNKELLAVAKLSQPLPVTSITDTNIIINLDMY